MNTTQNKHSNSHAPEHRHKQTHPFSALESHFGSKKEASLFLLHTLGDSLAAFVANGSDSAHSKVMEKLAFVYWSTGIFCEAQGYMPEM